MQTQAVCVAACSEGEDVRPALAQVYLPKGPPAWYKITDTLLSGAAPLGPALKVCVNQKPCQGCHNCSALAATQQ